MRSPNRAAMLLVFLAAYLTATVATARPSRADDPFEIRVEISDIRLPVRCTQRGWAVGYDRTTTITGARRTGFSVAQPAPVMRYFVQYVDDEVNLVHFWLSGFDAYVQNYAVSPPPGAERAWTGGSYLIPLWSDSYSAVSIEYLVYYDRLVWETRASIDCEDGKVVASDLTSQAVDGPRESLPKPGENLVLALEDIPRFSNPYNQTGYLGTIEACQTFYVSHMERPRATISTWVRESLTGQRMLLGSDGGEFLPIVDVHEDYGQPGGQPVLDQCAGS